VLIAVPVNLVEPLKLIGVAIAGRGKLIEPGVPPIRELRQIVWLTLSLFIGAFCAALAATEGGGLRDGTRASIRFAQLRSIAELNQKGNHHAHPALASRNPDPADHLDHASASLMSASRSGRTLRRSGGGWNTDRI
jgi:hypothetical protein